MKPDEVAHMVERLRRRSTFDYGITHIEMLKGAADMIERLAQQVPPDCVVVQDDYPLQFSAWLSKEMPAGTVIGDPVWWAGNLYRAMIAAGEVK